MPISQVSGNKLSNEEVSNTWNISPIVSTMTPPTGTIHQITLLSTNEASYVLRAYRYAQKDRSRIIAEHALSSYAQAHGIPAIAPLPLPSGETILEYEGRFYALFPFAKGQQVSREQVTSRDLVAAMGRCLGELHHILATYPREKVRDQSFTVDQSATYTKMERIEAAIAEKAHLDPFDRQILTMLSQRRTWLQASQSVDLKPFSLLDSQVLQSLSSILCKIVKSH